jgi:hypothetical protein
MFCSGCGFEIQNESAAFCSSCGTKVGQQGGNSHAIALNSMPPATVNPAKIAMFEAKNTGIGMEMDDVWGEKMFLYMNPQDKFDDCNKLFAALQEITKNRVMHFKSKGRPVVPVYRMKTVQMNDWWKRIEIDIEGAGLKWFEYQDKKVLHDDHNLLMNMMSR